MTNPHRERARVLLGMNRYAEAEVEVGRALAIEPNDALLHAWMALCLIERRAGRDAKKTARRAIGLAPDFGIAHYVLGIVCARTGDFDGAIRSTKESLRLEPLDPDYHQLLADVYLLVGRVREALEAADTGLRSDPKHVDCANVRARALVRLGRREEAAATLERALADNPEYFRTHENRGRLELIRGDVPAAMQYFREALRLNPNNTAARRGLVEALKSRNVIYRGLLWLFGGSETETSSPWRRRGLTVSLGAGAVVGLGCAIFTALAASGKSIFWEVFATAALVLSMAFWVLYLLSLVAFHWFGDVFFTLLLFVDPAGRKVLHRDEADTAKVLVVCGVLVFGLTVSAIVFRTAGPAVIAAAVMGMTFPWIAKLKRLE